MTRFRAGATVLVTLALAAFLFSAFFQAPTTLRIGDRDFALLDVQLNTFTASRQERVTLDMDNEGRVLAAWESRRQESGSYGVFARELDENGIARTGEIHVNEFMPGHQQHPVLALDNTGAFLAWDSWGQTGPGSVIIGRSLDGSEMALSSESGLHEVAAIAALPGGGRVLAWVRPDTEGSSRVVARRFDAQGELLGDEIVVSEGVNVLDRLATLDTYAEGFRVAWAREISGAGHVGVMSRAFDLEGCPISDELLLAEGGIEPSLACANDGRFVLAWMRAEDNAYVSTAQLFDTEGRSVSEIIIPDTSTKAQSGVAAAMRANGSFALAWNRMDDDVESSDVIARLYDRKGAALGESFRATKIGEGRQMMAVASGARRLAYGDDGRIALAWTGDSGHGDKSAANISLLIPEAGLRERASWAMNDLATRLKPAPETERMVIAMPHVPPTFEEPGEPVFEAELQFAGDRNRDEGFRLFTSTGWTPPDPHAAVGPEHIIGMANGGIICYEKDGTFLWEDDISGNNFWDADAFVFDPEAIYDPHSGRFMLMACERGDNGHSYFDFAISSDSTPTNNTSEWHKYRIDVTSWTDNDIDSPNMAVTDDAVYLTADFFGPDKYGILIIDKSSVLSGGTPVTTHYLHTGTQSHGIPMVYDAGLPMYMLEDAELWSSSSLKIYAIQNPLTAPSLVSTTFAVDTYWDPISVRSSGTSASITTFESRFWSCMQRDGKIWATHHVCPTSTRNTLAARWYEIDLNGWPDSGNAPFVTQSGDVLPNGSGFASFCSITANAFGQAALNFTYSSTSEFLNMYRVMRNPSDAPGTMQAPVLQKTSAASYSGSRWGDYSSIVVDPVDNKSFWSHGEYTPGSGSWSTWAGVFDPGGGTAVGADFPHHAVRAGGVWPNPTNGQSRFAFDLPAASNVSMDIFDVRGRLVRTLDGGEFGEGRNHIVWDGRNALGTDLPAGVYLARFNVGGRQLPGGSVTLVR
jgi:hypothetical protein